MFKRALRFASEGPIEISHALAPAWLNVKMMLDAKDEVTSEEVIFDALILDWFGSKVDTWSKTNMLDGDKVFGAICYEWIDYAPFLPMQLTTNKKILSATIALRYKQEDRKIEEEKKKNPLSDMVSIPSAQVYGVRVPVGLE